jgi:hypothetical protein
MAKGTEKGLQAVLQAAAEEMGRDDCDVGLVIQEVRAALLVADNQRLYGARARP